VEDVVSVSYGSSTFRGEPWLTIRFQLKLLGWNETVNTIRNPFRDDRCSFKFSRLKEKVERWASAMKDLNPSQSAFE
jgi:hypothetical protein